MNPRISIFLICLVSVLIFAACSHVEMQPPDGYSDFGKLKDHRTPPEPRVNVYDIPDCESVDTLTPPINPFVVTPPDGYLEDNE